MTNPADEDKNVEDDRFEELRRKVLDLAEINDLELLDIGAGPLSAIAAKDYGCYVTSVDINSEELHLWEDYAEKEGVSDRISFEEEDATSFSYCNDAFDVGICFCALHHIPAEKREKAVSELSRVSFERFIIAEYTVKGFLEVHSREEFEPVDLGSLEKILKNYGDLKIVPMEDMMVYIVIKAGN